MKRIFVVGCPRSGTTLVQTILAGHQGLVSFPESHVFRVAAWDINWRVYGPPLGRRARLKAPLQRYLHHFRASPELSGRIRLFLARAGLEGEAGRFDGLPDRTGPVLRSFVDLLDDHGGQAGWVEKTPLHLFCLDLIEHHVPDALFVHVWRDGPSTIASIVDAARTHKDWGRRYLKGAGTIPRLVSMWNRGYSVSSAFARKSNHMVILHENLVKDPQQETRRLMSHVGLRFDEELLALRTSSHVLDEEPWKARMGKSIRPQPSKFAQIFSKEEQLVIQRSLVAGGKPLGLLSTP